MELFEQFYLSALGLADASIALPWVENVFTPGGLCEREYTQVQDAYARLCNRLQVSLDDEDEDLNIILDSLSHIQREVGRAMFRAGMEYQRRISQ